MLIVTDDEFSNNKTNLLCFFLKFIKELDRLLRTNLWNRLADLKVTLEFIVVAINLYENIISMFRNIDDEIKCNIVSNRGFLRHNSWCIALLFVILLISVWPCNFKCTPSLLYKRRGLTIWMNLFCVFICWIRMFPTQSVLLFDFLLF